MDLGKSPGSAICYHLGMPSKGLRCDFCGRQVLRVRRIALDSGYDRLSQQHVVRYACERCSSRKEAERARQVDGQAQPL